MKPILCRIALSLALVSSLLFTACGGGSDSSADNNGSGTPPASDTQAPMVQISATAAQVTAAGTVQINATASDNVGVTALEFYDGSTRVAADAGNPSRASVAFTAADNGAHSFTVVAHDAAGHATTSTAVSVTVAIAVTQPSERQLKKSFLSLDGKQTVWYWEYLPPGYDLSKTYPLLVFFHGAGETGNPDGSELAKVKAHGPPKLINANNDMCFTTASGKQCFIVVSPQNGRGWWDGNDTAGMLAHAIKTYQVDPKRVYVTGLSMGGGATWNLAVATEAGVTPTSYWAAKIAAAVPIAGASDAQYFNTGICQGIVGKHLPIWAFHGTADTTVVPATSQAWVDKINGASTANGYSCATVASPMAKLTLYPGVGHDSWTTTYDPAHQVETGKNLYQWLLSYQRP